jgi:hypothetical protein
MKVQFSFQNVPRLQESIHTGSTITEHMFINLKSRKATFIKKSNQSLSVMTYALILVIRYQNPFDFRSNVDLIRFNSCDQEKLMV